MMTRIDGIVTFELAVAEVVASPNTAAASRSLYFRTEARQEFFNNSETMYCK